MAIVPDSQLSLAIGKEGQNVRLAAKLTGWKIDIKGESKRDEAFDAFEESRKENDIEDALEEADQDSLDEEVQEEKVFEEEQDFDEVDVEENSQGQELEVESISDEEIEEN